MAAKKEPFRQGIDRLLLSVERRTPCVPDDDRFHVVLDGSVVFSSSSQPEALTEYRKRRDALLAKEGFKPQPIDREGLLRRERAEREVNEVRGGSGVRSKLRVPGRRGHR